MRENQLSARKTTPTRQTLVPSCRSTQNSIKMEDYVQQYFSLVAFHLKISRMDLHVLLDCRASNLSETRTTYPFSQVISRCSGRFSNNSIPLKRWRQKGCVERGFEKRDGRRRQQAKQTMNLRGGWLILESMAQPRGCSNNEEDGRYWAKK